jgi:hypothetical protein
VAVVRELRGAMVLRGLDRGVIVTTSNRFSKAAMRAARSDPVHSTQQAIDLVDAKRLLEILKVVSVDGGARGSWAEAHRPVGQLTQTRNDYRNRVKAAAQLLPAPPEHQSLAARASGRPAVP